MYRFPFSWRRPLSCLSQHGAVPGGAHSRAFRVGRRPVPGGAAPGHDPPRRSEGLPGRPSGLPDPPTGRIICSAPQGGQTDPLDTTTSSRHEAWLRFSVGPRLPPPCPLCGFTQVHVYMNRVVLGLRNDELLRHL